MERGRQRLAWIGQTATDEAENAAIIRYHCRSAVHRPFWAIVRDWLVALRQLFSL